MTSLVVTCELLAELANDGGFKYLILFERGKEIFHRTVLFSKKRMTGEEALRMWLIEHD